MKLGTIDRHRSANRKCHKGVGGRQASATEEIAAQIPPRTGRRHVFRTFMDGEYKIPPFRTCGNWPGYIGITHDILQLSPPMPINSHISMNMHGTSSISCCISLRVILYNNHGYSHADFLS